MPPLLWHRNGIRGAVGAMLLLAAALIAPSALADSNEPSPPAPAEPFYRLEGGVPAGFEALTEPQRALVDVYYGERRVMRQMATYTPDTLLFDDAAALAAALPRSLQPEELVRELSGALPVNAHRLCRNTTEVDCNRLDPELVGVIFDESRFRADLFVNPRALVVQPVQESRFLPPPDTGFSMLQNFMATAAGSDRTEQLVNVGSFTTVAYDDTRLVSEASYTDAYGATFDRLFVQRDREELEYAAGIFRTIGRAFPFSGDQQMGGVRVASTLNTRTDLGLAYGTPIALSLTSRARVDFIKDGRLVGSRFYDAGNQMVDTSMLPEGAYDLLIRISEGGSVREETRFFSKSSRLPPKDQPLYQVEVGALLSPTTYSLFPEDSGELMARVGHSRRLTQSFGFDAGLAGTGAEQLVEFGLFRMDSFGGGDDYYELQASTFVGSESASGAAVNGQLRIGAVYVGVDVRSVRSETVDTLVFVDPLEVDPDLPGTGDPLPGDPPGSGDENDLSDGYSTQASLIPPSLDQANLTVQFPVLGGVAGFTASEIRRDEFEDVSRQSVTYRRPILEKLPGTAELRADVALEDDNVQALVGVRLYLRRDRWSGDVAPRYRYDDMNGGEPHGYQLDGSAQWTNPDFAGGELRLGASGFAQREADGVGVAAEVDNRLAQTHLSIDRYAGPDYDETSWAGSVFTSVLQGDDAWAVGGQNVSDAAVLVTLNGQSPDTDFEVVVDGYGRGYARGGTTTALHLPAYHTYQVRIRPRRSAFVEFDDSPRSVTLYPGNVARLDWEVKSLFVVLGRVVDASGNGVANARIEGAQGLAVTDEDGFFQAEVASSDETIELGFSSAAGSCQVAAPIVQKRGGVAFLETLSCTPGTGIARAR
jgi:hypothetical protein